MQCKKLDSFFNLGRVCEFSVYLCNHGTGFLGPNQTNNSLCTFLLYSEYYTVAVCINENKNKNKNVWYRVVRVPYILRSLKV